ncbi:MAG: DNA repair protein RecN, partial [Woeseia sp.]
MLTSLQVRNFAIIDRIEVDFEDGMTVLTGETGAGKSILIDALGLVLGERGGTGLVRDGADRADFSAEFDISGHEAARDWLAEQALDADEQCVLRRVINADGRSRAFINGATVTLQTVKELGELLLDIHGQHFHQSLGRRDVQRDLLDHFGQLLADRQRTAGTFDTWQRLADEHRALQAAESDRASRLELLRFQLNELDALDLKPGEMDELTNERRRLQNSGKIADGLTQALNLLDDADPDNVNNMLARAQQALDALADVDAELATTAAMLNEALIQVGEAADQLRRYGDTLDADPARREWVEDRLDAIKSVARKHRIDTSELDGLREQLADQLEQLENAEQRGAALAADTAKAEKEYRAAAATLGDGRRAAAKRFSSAVSAAMRDLGMPDGVFRIDLQARDPERARAWGMEDVEYLISANPGQAPMPLARIASGGELSRMSLAIQVIASNGSAIPTMIFDEVDSGVGGGIAEMVGRRLHELAAARQVLCVTHLPQVASQADHHLRINKITDGKTTKTSVTVLQHGERIEELARMLGGVDITQRTRDHAEEMLGKGGRKRKGRKR